MTKLQELEQQIGELKNEARGLVDAKDAAGAKAKMKEIEEIKALVEIEKALEIEEETQITNKIEGNDMKMMNTENKVNEVQLFAKLLAKKPLTEAENAMSEGVKADGGYTVPVDVLTRINELREQKGALQNVITVEPVSTETGSRVLKVRAQQTGFAKVLEGGTIAAKETPQFTNLEYKVEKYAGLFQATNELLEDTAENITACLVKWIGDESRVTRNKLILAELDKKAKTAVTGVDGIKSILNVKLDPAFRYTSVILTNQDGYNFMDTTFKDGNGRYLMQDSITAPTGKQLLGCDIIVVSNKDLPTVAGKAPIIIGDLKEAIVMFDRKTLSVKASDVAGTAFETDVTLFRAIEREDIKTRDAEAFVYGQITVTP